MFPSDPNPLEAVFVQRDTSNSHYDQINVSGSNLIVYLDENGKINADKVSVFATKYSLGGSITGSVASASWASRSLSSSYAGTASVLLGSITSASYSLTASYAISASEAIICITSSYFSGSQITASFIAVGTILPLSSSIGSPTQKFSNVFATNLFGTASFASQSFSASYVNSSSIDGTVQSSSYSVSSSISLIAAAINFTPSNSISSSFASSSISSSFASTAGGLNFVPLTATSASWISASVKITNADTASFVTASNVNGRVSSASYALTSLSSSVITSSTNALYNLLFVTGSGQQPIFDSTNIKVNPSSGSIQATRFSGSIYGIGDSPSNFIDLSTQGAMTIQAGGDSIFGDYNLSINSSNNITLNGSQINIQTNSSDIILQSNSNIQLNPSGLIDINGNLTISTSQSFFDTGIHAIFQGQNSNGIVIYGVGNGTLVNTVPLILTTDGGSDSSNKGIYLVTPTGDIRFEAGVLGTDQFSFGGSNFSVDKTGVPNGAFFIDNVNGFIGMWNPSPAYPLDVDGDANINGNISCNSIGTSQINTININIDSVALHSDAIDTLYCDNFDVTNTLQVTGSTFTNGIINNGFRLPAIQAGSASVNSGTSKIINFNQPMPNKFYSVSLTGESAITSSSAAGKTVNGFTASFSLFTGTFDWIAIGATQ